MGFIMKVNIEQNKRYYSSVQSLPCDCNYCKNYYLQIKTTYPNVCSYLESMGIDVLRPLELSSLEVNENNILEYCVCQYVVFGSYEENFHHKIGDVEFCIGTSYPNTGVNKEHFVLDFYTIFLPMKLPL